jgi:hypothetical protein
MGNYWSGGAAAADEAMSKNQVTIEYWCAKMPQRFCPRGRGAADGAASNR